jgi:hypothetical protein
MKFTKGDYKYRLDSPIKVFTDIKGIDVSYRNIHLSSNGELLLDEGYLWNGASGPTLDTEETHLPSAVHDAIYRLISLGIINKKYRKHADELFYKLMLKEVDRIIKEKQGSKYLLFLIKKALQARAYMWYKSVRIFGRMYV